MVPEPTFCRGGEARKNYLPELKVILEFCWSWSRIPTLTPSFRFGSDPLPHPVTIFNHSRTPLPIPSPLESKQNHIFGRARTIRNFCQSWCQSRIKIGHGADTRVRKNHLPRPRPFWNINRILISKNLNFLHFVFKLLYFSVFHWPSVFLASNTPQGLLYQTVVATRGRGAEKTTSSWKIPAEYDFFCIRYKK